MRFRGLRGAVRRIPFWSALAMGSIVLLQAVTVCSGGSEPGEDTFAARRARMVAVQIEARGVNDPQVLRAMGEVKRHLFVPESLQARAYGDFPLPIGEGQTISQPYIVALMTDLVDVDETSSVLEIGTGSGYQAAVLARIAGKVYSVEIVPALHGRAAQRLKEAGLGNVELLLGDGWLGWPEKAPFDAIVVTAAPPEIPPALIDQLKPGGRLCIPVGRQGATQKLIVVEKDDDGRLTQRDVLPVRFVPLVRGRD